MHSSYLNHCLKLLIFVFSVLTVPPAYSSSLKCSKIQGKSSFVQNNWIKYDAHDVRPFTGGQQGNADLWETPIDNPRLILKFNSGSFDSLIAEAKWLRWLNSHGLGVKFLGFTQLKDRLAIVIDKVSERNVILKEPNKIDTPEEYLSYFNEMGVSVTPKMISEIENATQFLTKGNVLAVDLQFLLTETGRVVLIDPESFRIGPNKVFTHV